jgi:hypothetical protein
LFLLRPVNFIVFKGEDLIELRLLLQSLLLSKALKLQQENEDKKNKFLISGIEERIEKLENSLK